MLRSNQTQPAFPLDLVLRQVHNVRSETSGRVREGLWTAPTNEGRRGKHDGGKRDQAHRTHVDGKAHSFEADPDMPLLYALRDDLGLKNPNSVLRQGAVRRVAPFSWTDSPSARA